MKLKQKICTIIAFAAFLFAAGLIENQTVAAFLLLAVCGAAVVIGGLDSKKTSVKQITRDYL